MAVTYDTVNVNSDTTGWTRLDVLDALETVFSNLGMHGGTAKNGVPVCALWPGQTNNEPPVPSFNSIEYTEVYNYDWMHCGGGGLAWNNTWADRKFEVISNSSTSYYMRETWLPSAVDTAADTVTVPYNDVLTTGKEVIWIPSGGDATNDIGGLTRGTTYYIIRVDATTIKLAANSTDAGNNTAISLSGSPSSGWNSTTRFWEPETGSSNAAITTYSGDILNFNVDAIGMHLCQNNSYVSTETLDIGNDSTLTYGPKGSNANRWPSGNGTATITWYTGYWIQSEDNANVESFDKPSSLPKGNVHQGNWRSTPTNSVGQYSSNVVEYCYAHDTHAAMKGSITVLPKYCSSSTEWHPYWDVTIPGTVTGGGGSGKDLKLRVQRWHAGSTSTYRGRVKQIDVLNVTDGWTGTPTFTISGEDIGGAATTNDIEFGTNTDETSADVGDGICSLVMTNYGAGSTFYQKSATGDYAVLKLVHDASKEWGTTYWVFAPHQTNTAQIQIFSGTYWETQNCWGTSATPDNTSRNDQDWKGFYGFMDGILGASTTERQFVNPYYNQYYYLRSYATGSQPTDYRLRLKYWRAQSPQDDSFAMIQFYQIINDINTEYFTFSLPADTWGVTSPGVDLDHLYHGHIVEYKGADSGGQNYQRAVDIRFSIPMYQYYTTHAGNEPQNASTLTMDSSYGYLRNPGTYNYPEKKDRYTSNIYTDNPVDEQEVVQYYRNADYDGTNSAVDFYRPIKGIPLLNTFAPCPYYLPDDFVMIQIGSAPGLTTFKTGDTITISNSEKYEIIVAGVNNSVEGLDGVSSGSSIGMCLCARIVG